MFRAVRLMIELFICNVLRCSKLNFKQKQTILKFILKSCLQTRLQTRLQTVGDLEGGAGVRGRRGGGVGGDADLLLEKALPVSLVLQLLP